MKTIKHIQNYIIYYFQCRAIISEIDHTNDVVRSFKKLDINENLISHPRLVKILIKLFLQLLFEKYDKKTLEPLLNKFSYFVYLKSKSCLELQIEYCNYLSKQYHFYNLTNATQDLESILRHKKIIIN
jgi:hypothetical protein